MISRIARPSLMKARVSGPDATAEAICTATNLERRRIRRQGHVPMIWEWRNHPHTAGEVEVWPAPGASAGTIEEAKGIVALGAVQEE